MSISKLSDSRWWEFYFVRYLVGTVVGGAIALYLNSPKTSSLSNLILPGVANASQLNSQSLVILAVLGFAYCYIASAPILVLHAARGAYLSNNKKDRCTFIVALLVIGITYGGLYSCSSYDKHSIGAFTLLIIVILLQIIPLIHSLMNMAEIPHNYYSNLAKARSQDTEEIRQYIESYKHLREHGNAFFIVFFEIVLGLMLALLSRANLAVVLLMCWIFPAALVWFLGTRLEHRLANPIIITPESD